MSDQHGARTIRAEPLVAVDSVDSVIQTLYYEVFKISRSRCLVRHAADEERLFLKEESQKFSE